MEEDIIDQLYFGRIVPWERQVEKPPEIEKYSDQVCEDAKILSICKSCWMKLVKVFWSGFWITNLK